MEACSTADLPESIVFTARKARVRSNTQDASSSSELDSSSREYYSARMHSIMERESELIMSQEDAEIEASKDHWTVVEPDFCTAATVISTDSSTSELVSVSCPEALTESEITEIEGTESERTESNSMTLYEKNVMKMQRLQEEYPESRFFKVGDDGIVLGRKIAEGGQAEIFEVQGSPAVLKVFKAGQLVSALKKQWPRSVLHRRAPTNDGYYGDNYFYNPVLSGRLLGNGRFAFEMVRLWGDLRKLLDERMKANGNRHPPFMMPDGNYHECCILSIILCIAIGMRGLHREGTLHRDLKASNVLITSTQFVKNESQFSALELKHDIKGIVADYECSIGVVGTGYWRAPEILDALRTGTADTTEYLFSEKSDVYSFAMTCYEVLTGWKPFEGVDCNREVFVDEVLGGRRPILPSHLKPWMVELMNACWHMNPSRRPAFDHICSLLAVMSDRTRRSESVFFKYHV